MIIFNKKVNNINDIFNMIINELSLIKESKNKINNK